jgi:hypothetical protein
MTSVQEGRLFRENIEVGCECYNPNLLTLITSQTPSDYIQLKKNYIAKYLINIVIHKSSDLIGLKKCFGRKKTNAKLVQSSYRSHLLTLKNFKEYISASNNKHCKLIFMPANEKQVSVEKYIETVQSVCVTFENVFNNITGDKYQIELDLLVKSCQFQLQTLNIFEKFVAKQENKNGGSLETVQQQHPQDGSVQLG